MVKLSFIVPIYNVEKYLRKCVDSLLTQDFDSYEIILVDDGSTDNSPQICDEYVRAFDIGDLRLEIKCIHQANAGLSVARNAGLMMAKGEYVCFVDSDDYWEENVLGGLMKNVERDNLDVLRFKYQNVRIVKESFELERDKNSEERIVNSGEEDVKYEVFNPNKLDPYRNDNYSEDVTDGVSFLNSRFGTACYAVMFIVRRSLLIGNLSFVIGDLNREDCLFTEGMYFEDVDWTPRMLQRARRAASTDTIVYNYLVRKGSITQAVLQSKKQKVLDDKMRLIRTMQEQSAALWKSGRYNRWYQVMIAMTVVSIVGMLSKEFYAEHESYIEQLIEMKALPIKNISMKARLINISPKLIIKLLHLKNGK